jgi:hypothetical protein
MTEVYGENDRLLEAPKPEGLASCYAQQGDRVEAGFLVDRVER